MRDLKELFDAVTGDTRADRNVWNEQDRRQRRSARNRKTGALVAAAAVIVAIGAFIATSVFDRREGRPVGVAPVSIPPKVLPRNVQDAAILSVDGAPLGSISGLPADAGELDLSPDGTMVAFVTADGGNGGLIATMRVDGTDLHVLTTGNPVAEQPAWSPDGSKIAFKWNPGAGRSDIYVMDADGSNVTRLTDSRYDDYDPRWSPDGRTIVYVNFGPHTGADQQFVKTPHIYSVPATGGAPTQLTTEPGPDIYPDFSPDGTQIVYRHDHQLRVMNADGSHPRVLLRHGDYFTPRWSPDGGRIAYGIYSDRFRPTVEFAGSTNESPLLLLRVLDVSTGASTAVGDTGFAYDWNSPIWWSNDAILIRRVGH